MLFSPCDYGGNTNTVFSAGRPAMSEKLIKTDKIK
jgi:hypothetical protein